MPPMIAPGSRSRRRLLVCGVASARATCLASGTQPTLGGGPADFQAAGLPREAARSGRSARSLSRGEAVEERLRVE
eukprot:15457806-Alexandrium_andersonii.AAC.1